MQKSSRKVLLKVYKLCQNSNDGFVSEEDLKQKNISIEVVWYLDLYDFVMRKRENKTTYFQMGQKGLDAIDEYHKEFRNLILAYIAAVSSIIGVAISVLALLK